MSRRYTEIVFTDDVKRTQEHYGARVTAAKVEAWEVDDEHLSEREAGFIQQRDSFYMATVNADGWPYLQFRGGPRGFVKILDASTLGYADFRGNKQYVSTGNLEGNDRVALFFMDYSNRKRLKVMARAEVADVAERPQLAQLLVDADYGARVERVVLLRVAAFDWNCSQHITPRWTEQELAGAGRRATAHPEGSSPGSRRSGRRSRRPL